MAPPGTSIRELFLGPTEALWVVTEDGLSCLRRGAFESLDARPGLALRPTGVAVTDAGVVVATRKGLYWIDELSPRLDPRLEKPGEFQGVARRGRSLLFVKAQGGLLQNDLDRQGRLRHRWGALQLPPNSSKVLPSPADSMLIQTTTRELLAARQEGSSWESRPVLEEDEEETLKSFRHGEKGTWLLTSMRLILYRGFGDRDTETFEVPSDSLIVGLGPNDKVWIATRSSLWEVHEGGRFERFSLPPQVTPTAIVQQEDGSLWLGTTDGLYFADPTGSRLVGLSLKERVMGSSSGEVGEPSDRQPALKFGFSSRGTVWAASATELHDEVENEASGGARMLSLTETERSDGALRYVFVGREHSLVELWDGVHWLREAGSQLGPAAVLWEDSDGEGGGDPARSLAELCPFYDGSSGPPEPQVLGEVDERLVVRFSPSCLLLLAPERPAVPLRWAPERMKIHRAEFRDPGTDGTGGLLGWTAEGEPYSFDLDDLSGTLTEYSPPTVDLEGWEWRLKPVAERSSGRILGILPSPGGGVFVGCWECGSSNVFYGDLESGSFLPLDVPAEKVGCGNNALLRDAAGTLWFSTVGGILRRRDGDAEMSYVQTSDAQPFRQHINAIIEFPAGSGHLWMNGSGGVWLMKGESAPTSVLVQEKVGVSLLGHGNVIWAGGEGFLAKIDATTGERLDDLWPEIAELLPSVSVVGAIANRQGAVLVATNLGVLEISQDGLELIPTADTWPTGVMNDGVEMVAMHNGAIAVALRASNSSSLWILDPGAEQLTPIGGVDFAIGAIAAVPPAEGRPATENDLLIGSSGSLYRLRGSELARVGGPSRWIEYDGAVWLLTPAGITRRGGDQQLRLYPRLAALDDDLRFSIDDSGVWLVGPAADLWRWEGQIDRAREDDQRAVWSATPDSKVRAGSTLFAIASLSDSAAVVFTSAGPTWAARRPGAAHWEFAAPDSRGIVGSAVQVACEIAVPEADRIAVALGTDLGLTLVSWARGQDRVGDLSWSHLDQTDGIIGSDVRACAWSPSRRELWIGTGKGLSVLALEEIEDDSRESVHWDNRAFVKKELEGFESEVLTWEIHQIRIDRGGNNVWVASGSCGDTPRPDCNRVARISLDTQTASLTEPFRFAAPDLRLDLGPALEGAPDLLVEDTSRRQFSLWEMAAFTKPRLTLTRWLVGLRIGLVIDSLDPEVVSASWRRQSAVDAHPRTADSSRPWLWEPDLLRLVPKEHILFSAATYSASGQPGGAGDRSYRLASPLEPGRDIWLGRILLLAIVVALGWYAKRRVDHTRAIRAQKIPYIAGQAVTGESFFGRSELLRKLASTVALNSYALVGEFRIGKTSIQRQLRLLLSQRDDDQRTFLFVPVDLQYLRGDWEEEFFPYLGKQLYQAAEETGCTESLLGQLNYSAVENPTDYDAQALANDAKYLLAHAGDAFSVVLFQIDEAGLMEKLSYDSLLQFRAAFTSARNIQVILSGRSLPPDRKGGNLSPWSNFLKEVIEITPLTLSEARELIVKPARDANLFSFDEEAIELLHALSEGRPIVLQRMCANLCLFKFEKQRLGKVTVEDVNDSRRWAKRHKLSETLKARGEELPHEREIGKEAPA